VTGGEADAQAARLEFRFQHAQRGDGDGQDRGLGVLGELQLVFGPFEDNLGERKAERVIGLVKDRARGGRGVIERAAHADGLRALAGKEKCECGYGGVSHQG
jgi:hypothetical protein